MDLNKLRDLTANDFSDPALAIIKAVLTDVFLNTPGFNGKPAGPLFSDHSDPLLSADLCNKLMHDDVSFGSFLSNLKNYQVMFGVIISKFKCLWKDGRYTVYLSLIGRESKAGVSLCAEPKNELQTLLYGPPENDIIGITVVGQGIKI